MEQFENFSMPISRQQEYMMYGENYGQRDATSILAEGRYLRGKMDLQRMRESIFMVAQMHEALRMVCVKDGDSYILKLKSGKNNTPVFTTDEFHTKEEVQSDVLHSIENSMELEKALFTARVYSLSEEKHILVVIMHHIIADSVALSVVLADILSCYEGTVPDISSTAQFSEFLADERSFLESDAGKKQLEYWKKEMDGYIPSNGDGGGEWYDVIKESTFYVENGRLNERAAELNVSSFVLILAASHRAIAEITGTNDTTIGIAFANRIHKKYRKTVGYLAHMIQNRIKHEDTEDADKLIKAVAAKLSENIKYQRLSQYAPLAKINIGVQDNPFKHDKELFCGSSAERVIFDIERSVDYIMIGVVPSSKETRINLNCDPNVYSRNYTNKLIGCLKRAIDDILYSKEI